MFRKKQAEGTVPLTSRSRYKIRSSASTLIRLANYAEARSLKSDHTHTGSAEAALAREITRAENELVNDILCARAEGVGAQNIMQEVIRPILNDAVVSEVARLALAHALERAEEAMKKQSSIQGGSPAA